MLTGQPWTLTEEFLSFPLAPVVAGTLNSFNNLCADWQGISMSCEGRQPSTSLIVHYRSKLSRAFAEKHMRWYPWCRVEAIAVGNNNLHLQA